MLEGWTGSWCDSHNDVILWTLLSGTIKKVFRFGFLVIMDFSRRPSTMSSFTFMLHQDIPTVRDLRFSRRRAFRWQSSWMWHRIVWSIGTKVSQETAVSSQFSSSSVRWRNQVPASRYYVFAKLHVVTSQKIFMLTSLEIKIGRLLRPYTPSLEMCIPEVIALILIPAQKIRCTCEYFQSSIYYFGFWWLRLDWTAVKLMLSRLLFHWPNRS
jgi:hypothetical protein